MHHGDAWDLFFKRIGHTWEDAQRCHRMVSYGMTRHCCPISLKSCPYPPWYNAIKAIGDGSNVLGVPKRSREIECLIGDCIHLHETIAERCRAAYAAHLANHRHVIGLHVRGPGRTHDGTLLLHWRCGYTEFPDYNAYAVRVERHMRDDSVVLLGTDAGCVQDYFRKRWGDRLICAAPAQKHVGEAHHHPENITPYELGVQALVDAYLLASSSVFVHGCSNMSNFILCMAPEMQNEDIYEAARHVDFSKLPPPAELDMIKEWILADPTGKST